MDLSTSAGLPAKVTLELAAAAGLTVSAAAALAAALDLSAPFILFTALLGLGLGGVVGLFWKRASPDKRPVDVSSLGPANRITLARGALICTVAGFIPFAEYAQAHAWIVAFITLAALILDGVDGAAARRTQSQSAFGARFDMELDALLILILCGLLITLEKAGAWVLLIGLMRYAFVIAGWFYPVLNQPLPESFRRKTVCVWQLVTLVICLLPPVPSGLAMAFLALSLALLVYSFGKDIGWLLRSPEAKKPI
ncbi:CDP-alcohol phosphatidyltransferase family protein [Marinobacter fonticola]|uniref:CDP-alcohol phosphatidyltransferase family protein n=1 Tax=Marinobacter fonticola TaxID=2603215 RepID=UPI0011E60D86|nr:CDP-alcohol phosphatidyltransferase family protein [Marinobacter fonticola]